MKINSELIKFAIRFSLLAGILLMVFYFIFPYYRLALRYSVGLFYAITDVQLPNRILLTVMPYVALTSLILATPKRNIKEKIKFLLLIYILFYFIDISFSIIQIFLSKYINQILVIQDLFTIALPIAFWWLFSYKHLSVYFNNQQNTTKT